MRLTQKICQKPVMRGERKSSKMIRVSCAILDRIKSSDGRFLLTLNKNRLSQGVQIFSPVGGAIYANDLSRLSSLKVIFEKKDSRDFRFFIEESKLPEFEKWFYERNGRETNPFRELYEELVIEEEILKDLNPRDVISRFLGTITMRLKSSRDIASGILTKYYFEIYEVEFSTNVWAELMQGLTMTKRARLVSASEILSEKTLDNISISKSAKALLKL